MNIDEYLFRDNVRRRFIASPFDEDIAEKLITCVPNIKLVCFYSRLCCSGKPFENGSHIPQTEGYEFQGRRTNK